MKQQLIKMINIRNILYGLINKNETNIFNSMSSAFAKAKASRDLRVWITFSSANKFSEQLYQKIQDKSKLKYPEIKFCQIKDMHECKKTKVLFKQDDEAGNEIKLFEDNTNPANLIILDSEDSFATLGMVAEYYQNFSNRTLILKSAKHNLIENASFTNKRCLNLIKLIKPNYYHEYNKFEDAIDIVMNFLDAQISTNIKKFIEEKNFDTEDLLFMAFYILQQSNINKAIEFIKKKIKHDVNVEQTKAKFEMLKKEKYEIVNKKLSVYRLKSDAITFYSDEIKQLANRMKKNI